MDDVCLKGVCKDSCLPAVCGPDRLSWPIWHVADSFVISYSPSLSLIWRIKTRIVLISNVCESSRFVFNCIEFAVHNLLQNFCFVNYIPKHFPLQSHISITLLSSQTLYTHLNVYADAKKYRASILFVRFHDRVQRQFFRNVHVAVAVGVMSLSFSTSLQ